MKAELATWRADAALVSELLAVDPAGLGGVRLRASAGPERDLVCGWIQAAWTPGSPFLRVPLHVSEDRLLGGLSLAATLQAGHVVAERGLLAEADGGAIVLAMAERLGSTVCSHVGSALDRGELSLERDGIAARVPCRIGVVALDEGIDDESAPAALCDRLAFALDLGGARSASADPGPDDARVRQARALWPDVEIGDDMVDALCIAASALGVASLRAPLLAAAAARAHAALCARTQVSEVDVSVAARLVLGPRATQMPVEETAEDETTADDRDESVDPSSSPPPPEPREDESHDDPGAARDAGSLEDLVVQAARSGIPEGLLEMLGVGRQAKTTSRRGGRVGALRGSRQGGRPTGTRAAMPREGEKLNVVETLRAAAPWQRVRRQERAGTDASSAVARLRVEVRKQDFRVTRFEARNETTVIFCVDASGSAAMQRLAEAKGAVEQVLADCYARRDHVALVAFRGATATLLLPPTRSLARVRRRLADLAGGGTTPLAAGIDAALALAADARKQEKTALIVLMTDGRANVGKNGSDRRAAGTDALASARLVRASGVRALLLDTAPRPRAEARLLAEEMGARYLPMPYADPAFISRQVQTLAASEAR